MTEPIAKMSGSIERGLNATVEALLSLQEQDQRLDEIAVRLQDLVPKREALDRERQTAERLLDETKQLVAEDERRQRELENRIAEHRQRHERNVAHLDSVKRMREATAAMAQVEAGRRLLLEEEAELKALVARVSEGHAAVKRLERGLQELDATQAAARQALAEAEAELRREQERLEALRAELARAVEPALLAKYERIRNRRKGRAVYALDGVACGCCETAVPVQRRKMMGTTGAIEVCETCGVLLYASAG